MTCLKANTITKKTSILVSVGTAIELWSYGMVVRTSNYYTIGAGNTVDIKNYLCCSQISEKFEGPAVIELEP